SSKRRMSPFSIPVRSAHSLGRLTLRVDVPTFWTFRLSTDMNLGLAVSRIISKYIFSRPGGPAATSPRQPLWGRAVWPGRAARRARGGAHPPRAGPGLRAAALRSPRPRRVPRLARPRGGPPRRGPLQLARRAAPSRPSGRAPARDARRRRARRRSRPRGEPRLRRDAGARAATPRRPARRHRLARHAGRGRRAPARRAGRGRERHRAGALGPRGGARRPRGGRHPLRRGRRDADASPRRARQRPRRARQPLGGRSLVRPPPRDRPAQRHRPRARGRRRRAARRRPLGPRARARRGRAGRLVDGAPGGPHAPGREGRPRRAPHRDVVRALLAGRRRRLAPGRPRRARRAVRRRALPPARGPVGRGGPRGGPRRLRPAPEEARRVMTLGAILLLAAALLAGAALAAPGRWRLLLARAHATAVLLAFAVMLVAFLAGDLGYAYVWDHTRQDYALPYKLAGLWGGEEGTLLLWNAAVAAFLVLVLRKEGALHRRAAGFLLAMGGALALVNLLAGAFDATDPAKLALAPQGRGLADVLLTPLMVIHPPVQFVGYALMAVPAAYALAGWWGPERDDRSWAGPAFRWARVAWLFATLGLGLGALWAYYVLSFGGYWAWDPVETSNLLPWLALTAFLHAGKGLTQRGDHPVAAPLLAFGAHALTLFATFATRSGLWVSVHAFTDPTNRFEPDAGLRLLAILGASPESRLLLGLLTATVLSGMALFALRHARGWGLRLHAALLLALAGAAALDPAFVWGLALQAGSLAPFGLAILAALLLGAPPVAVFLRADESRRKLALDQRTLLSIAVALLAIGLAVALLLDVQVVNGPDRRLFDERAPVLVLPVIAALTLVLSVGPLGKRGATLLAGAGFLGGVAGFLLFPQARVLALAAPPLAAALAAALLKLAHVQGPAGGARLKAAGLLSGIASLLGLALWGNPPTWVSGLAIPEGLSLALGFVGVALSALGLAGAFVAWRGRAY